MNILLVIHADPYESNVAYSFRTLKEGDFVVVYVDGRKAHQEKQYLSKVNIASFKTYVTVTH